MMESAAAMLKKTYAGRRVLVTGHTGFKGSWLSIWLSSLGAKVIGYALDPYTERDNFIVSNVAGQVTDIRGDVRDFETLSGVFKAYNPDFVFHLAAQALVRRAYENPKETYDVNVGGTVNVFECCRLSGSVKVIINITSDKCYENKEWLWGYRENDPMGGYDPYSSSKGCSELVTAAYRNSFFNADHYQDHGKAVASVRAGNVIGGGDWAQDRIIPDSIRALEAGEPILIRNPQAVRPWQFVLEPLSGYLLLGARMAERPAEYAGPWNFGPESRSVITVREIVELVLQHWGSGSWKPAGLENQPHEAGLLALDISKVRHRLGWTPALTVEETVKETVAWYRECKRSSDMHAFCRAQIENYMEAMQVLDAVSVAR
jgi:CDP-glucose 4,6-dehydratase